MVFGGTQLIAAANEVLSTRRDGPVWAVNHFFVSMCFFTGNDVLIYAPLSTRVKLCQPREIRNKLCFLGNEIVCWVHAEVYTYMNMNATSGKVTAWVSEIHGQRPSQQTTIRLVVMHMYSWYFPSSRNNGHPWVHHLYRTRCWPLDLFIVFVTLYQVLYNIPPPIWPPLHSSQHNN